METMTPEEILDIPLSDNDAEASTIREYLKALLRGVWDEGEGFNGKRPFGNSGWEYDIYVGLLRAGAVSGTLDADGYVETVDTRQADRLIAEAIDSL